MTSGGFIETDGVLRVGAHGAHAIFTGRSGGVSAAPYDTLNVGPWCGDRPEDVAENQRRVAAIASADGQRRRLIIGRQVHESSVAAHLEGCADAQVDGVDAQVTDRRDLAVGVLTADCVPVALLAPWGVGVAHAGWRGLAGGVVGGAIGELLALAGPDAHPEHISVFIGPCAGPCCYEVGDEVHAAFAGWPGHDGASRTLDLPSLTAAAAAHERVGEVAVAGRCTICEPGWFSHRGSGGTTGRQAGVAWRG